jgi:predicted kinase
MNATSSAIATKLASKLGEQKVELRTRTDAVRKRLIDAQDSLYSAAADLMIIRDKGLYRATGEFKTFSAWYEAQGFALTREKRLSQISTSG